MLYFQGGQLATSRKWRAVDVGSEVRTLLQTRGPADGKGGTRPRSPTIITADFKLKWPPGHVNFGRFHLRRPTMLRRLQLGRSTGSLPIYECTELLSKDGIQPSGFGGAHLRHPFLPLPRQVRDDSKLPLDKHELRAMMHLVLFHAKQ